MNCCLQRGNAYRHLVCTFYVHRIASFFLVARFPTRFPTTVFEAYLFHFFLLSFTICTDPSFLQVINLNQSWSIFVSFILLIFFSQHQCIYLLYHLCKYICPGVQQRSFKIEWVFFPMVISQ